MRKLELVVPQDQVIAAEAEVEAKRAQRDEAREALTECAVRAPCAGEVLRVLVGPGDVAGSQPALLFCPDRPRIVRAEVPQEFAGSVKAGQAALLEDDSRPGETWKGKVVRVSGWLTQRRSVLQEPAQRNDIRTLECIVEPEANGRPLRIGQRMRVVLAVR
jgi:multidrug resistance efflux pump